MFENASLEPKSGEALPHVALFIEEFEHAYIG